MKNAKSVVISLFLAIAAAAGAARGADEARGQAAQRTASGEGAGVSFVTTLPAGYELQGTGPEWYVVEKGTTRPLVLVRFQLGRTIAGLVAEGFERIDDRSAVKFADGVTGAVILGSYQAPPGAEYLQPWYLHPAPGADGIFMIAEFRARPWKPFEEFARSFRYTP